MPGYMAERLMSPAPMTCSIRRRVMASASKIDRWGQEYVKHDGLMIVKDGDPSAMPTFTCQPKGCQVFNSKKCQKVEMSMPNTPSYFPKGAIWGDKNADFSHLNYSVFLRISVLKMCHEDIHATHLSPCVTQSIVYVIHVV